VIKGLQGPFGILGLDLLVLLEDGDQGKRLQDLNDSWVYVSARYTRREGIIVWRLGGSAGTNNVILSHRVREKLGKSWRMWRKMKTACFG
jgi:hypothetical protein